MAKKESKGLLHTQIGEQLKKLRVARGLTLNDAGPKTGTMGSQLSNIEKGKDNISVSVLQRIVTGLGGKLEVNIVFDEEATIK